MNPQAEGPCSLSQLILPRRDAGAGDLAVDPLEQAGEDAAGADLVEGVEAVGEHPAHRVFPADALEDLGDQGPADVVGVGVGRGVDVGVDGDARWVDRALRRGPRRAGRRPASSGAEWNAPATARGTTFMAPSSVAIGVDLLEGRRVARDDDVARPEQVGLPEPADGCDAAAKLVDGRLVEAEHAGHAAGRGEGGGLHRLAAAADDLEAGLEVERPGEDQRGVLAQAQPGGALAGGDDLGVASPSGSSSAARLATKIAGWLTSVASSASAGPSMQQSPQVDAEDLAGPVEQSLGPPGSSWSSSRPIPTVCAPWPGNKKAILGIGGVSFIPRPGEPARPD